MAARADREGRGISTRQPSWFIPHGGGPCFFMDGSAIGPADTRHGMDAFLRGLLDDAPRPRAILVISAHWEAPAFTVNAAAQPPLLFDYSGFPEHTYQLEYPAPGAPALALRVCDLIADAGLPAASITDRGLDHGVFVPMLLIDPPARIPVVQLSLRQGLDPAEYIRLGQALAPLRDDGVLILGSGMSYHDVRALMRGNSAQDAQTFDDWLTTAVTAAPAHRDAALIEWARAPAARAAHPREEHLLPLMVAAGAAGRERGVRVCDIIGLGRPLCTDTDFPKRLLAREVDEAPRYEKKLKLGSARWLSGASPLFFIKLINVLGQQDWYYQQLFRLADDLEPDLKRGVAKSFFAYLADEQTVALRMRKARRALDAGAMPPGE